MIKATLADLRQSSTFFKTNEIIEIVNGRKKEQKRKLLKRVASASKRDIIGDGALDDGIK
jgi:hypothetical protein